MKKLLVGLSVAGIFFGAVLNASAEMVRATWTGDVYFVYDIPNDNAASIWEIGDTFTLSYVFDDTSYLAHFYSDGPNGIAELGGGDDYVSHVVNDFSDVSEIQYDGRTNEYRATGYDNFSSHFFTLNAPMPFQYTLGLSITIKHLIGPICLQMGTSPISLLISLREMEG